MLALNKNIISRKNYVRLMICFNTMLLLSANFVGNHSLQIFYFTYSTGTLLIQLVFCGIIAFTETLGFRKTAQMIWITTAINLVVALSLYFVLASPIPEFWVEPETVQIERGRQLNVVLMLSIGYAFTAQSIVYVAGKLRLLFGKRWLILRMILLVLTGLLIDMTMLTLAILFMAEERYMTLWKMLSLVSVKLSFCFFAIPLSYLLVLILKRTTHKL
jgi:uncharacterized PurR-regulated membrane protein YhhQ (DUF165 family)